MCMPSCEQQRCLRRGSRVEKSFLEEGKQPGEVTLTPVRPRASPGGLQEGEELGGSCRGGVQECLMGERKVDM